MPWDWAPALDVGDDDGDGAVAEDVTGDASPTDAGRKTVVSVRVYVVVVPDESRTGAADAVDAWLASTVLLLV